jgi:hypothetical protein
VFDGLKGLNLRLSQWRALSHAAKSGSARAKITDQDLFARADARLCFARDAPTTVNARLLSTLRSL